MLLDVKEGRLQVATAHKDAEEVWQLMKGYIVTIDSLQGENMRLQKAVKR